MRLCLTGIAQALRVPLVRQKSDGWDDGYVCIGEGDRDSAQACLIDQAGKRHRIVVCYRKTLTKSAGEILHELGHLAVPGSFADEDMLMIWMAEATKRLTGAIGNNCRGEMERYGYPWCATDAEENQRNGSSVRYGIVGNFEAWITSAEYSRDFDKAKFAGIILRDGSPRLRPVQ
jgi:hypothetical protein